MKQTSKGILLIALGHPNYYKMAVNLAASIRVNDPGLQIAIVTDGTPLIDTKFFDQSIIAPIESYKTDGRLEYIKSKTWMYHLSPFDETIFLDVDMIMLTKRSLTAMFNKLAPYDWSIANTGEAGRSVWADIDEVKKAYKTDRTFYNYHSEFVYFKKKAAVKKYFDKVRSVFEKPKVKGTNFGGARIADELAFQIASMVLDYYPPEKNFLPTFWFGRYKQAMYGYTYKIDQSYISYSIGGNAVPKQVKENYNNLASFYALKMGLQRPYQVTDKKSFAEGRVNI